MQTELVMYSRTMGCPFVSLARRVFEQYDVTYREIHIDQDHLARQRVLNWTGFLSVPTLVIAAAGQDLPLRDPEPIEAGSSPRGKDRGWMITEPNTSQLIEWLQKHQFIAQENAAIQG